MRYWGVAGVGVSGTGREPVVVLVARVVDGIGVVVVKVCARAVEIEGVGVAVDVAEVAGAGAELEQAEPVETIALRRAVTLLGLPVVTEAVVEVEVAKPEGAPD